ncbi:hypothetical protein VPH35_007920 [Triticum aestivum]
MLEGGRLLSSTSSSARKVPAPLLRLQHRRNPTGASPFTRTRSPMCSSASSRESTRGGWSSSAPMTSTMAPSMRSTACSPAPTSTCPSTWTLRSAVRPCSPCARARTWSRQGIEEATDRGDFSRQTWRGGGGAGSPCGTGSDEDGRRQRGRGGGLRRQRTSRGRLLAVRRRPPVGNRERESWFL